MARLALEITCLTVVQRVALSSWSQELDAERISITTKMSKALIEIRIFLEFFPFLYTRKTIKDVLTRTTIVFIFKQQVQAIQGFYCVFALDTSMGLQVDWFAPLAWVSCQMMHLQSSLFAEGRYST